MVEDLPDDRRPLNHGDDPHRPTAARTEQRINPIDLADQMAANLDIPIVALVFNDSAYGVLRPQQQARYGCTIASDLVDPDFVALTQAYGIDARRVISLDELGPAVSEAIDSNRPHLIEVPIRLPQPVMEPAPRRLHMAQHP